MVKTGITSAAGKDLSNDTQIRAVTGLTVYEIRSKRLKNWSGNLRAKFASKTLSDYSLLRISFLNYVLWNLSTLSKQSRRSTTAAKKIKKEQKGKPKKMFLKLKKSLKMWVIVFSKNSKFLVLHIPKQKCFKILRNACFYEANAFWVDWS